MALVFPSQFGNIIRNAEETSFKISYNVIIRLNAQAITGDIVKPKPLIGRTCDIGECPSVLPKVWERHCEGKMGDNPKIPNVMKKRTVIQGDLPKKPRKTHPNVSQVDVWG
jgi:hypothetical protein